MQCGSCPWKRGGLHEDREPQGECPGKMEEDVRVMHLPAKEPQGPLTTPPEARVGEKGFYGASEGVWPCNTLVLHLCLQN